jgi:hypothetical protein
MSEVSGVAELQAARRDLEQAKAAISTQAKSVLKGVVEKIFDENPDIQTIAWAQKASEYNDEGMYPGLFGPVANPEPDEDGDYRGYGYSSNWLYPSYNDKFVVAPQLKELDETLQAIGEDELSQIFGDEHSVTVTNTENGPRFTTEYEGI